MKEINRLWIKQFFGDDDKSDPSISEDGLTLYIKVIDGISLIRLNEAKELLDARDVLIEAYYNGYTSFNFLLKEKAKLV